VIIQLSNGHLFDLERPDPSLIDIRMLAASLSKLCRFNGHVKRFYSVAEHCVFVSELVAPEFALKGLLHDATEAFVGDMVSPLKATQPAYKKVEHRVARAIKAAFFVPDGGNREVKQADRIAGITEANQLMPPSPYWDSQQPYWGGAKPLEDPPRLGWSIRRAELEYLDRFEEIMTGKGAPRR
jgi:hypothetical protein